MWRVRHAGFVDADPDEPRSSPPGAMEAFHTSRAWYDPAPRAIDWRWAAAIRRLWNGGFSERGLEANRLHCACRVDEGEDGENDVLGERTPGRTKGCEAGYPGSGSTRRQSPPLDRPEVELRRPHPNYPTRFAGGPDALQLFASRDERSRPTRVYVD